MTAMAALAGTAARGIQRPAQLIRYVKMAGSVTIRGRYWGRRCILNWATSALTFNSSFGEPAELGSEVTYFRHSLPFSISHSAFVSVVEVMSPHFSTKPPGPSSMWPGREKVRLQV